MYYGPYTGTYTVTATLVDGTAGLGEVIFPATTGPGAAYGLDGVTATVRSHVYPFTAF